MTLEDVHYVDFFPRFYNSLRSSSSYKTDPLLRIHLFEVFLNYVLLSKKRVNVVKIISAFIEEEEQLNNKENVISQVVEITLEAFKVVTPDTGTVLKLAQLSKMKGDKETISSILSNFFVACDNEISLNFEENDVNLKLLELLECIEQNVESPLMEYVNLLYFATKNSLDDCSLKILEKIINFTQDFTDKTLVHSLEDDEMMAITCAALKFGNYKESARTLTRALKRKKKKDFSKYSESDWITLLHWRIYNLKDAETEKQAIDVINGINDKLKQCEKDFRFDSTSTYNYAIDALCYSKQSIEVIESFTEAFDEQFGLTRDAYSFASLINYHLSYGNYEESLDLFERSLQEMVSWDEDYGGFYIPVLFKLLTVYCNESKDDPYAKGAVYKKIRNFGVKLDKKSTAALIRVFLQDGFVGDSIAVFERETPALEPETRYDSTKFKEAFDAYFNYILQPRSDLDYNWHIYEFLDKNFTIPYELYPSLLQFFINSKKPYKALRIFADMKKLSKEFKLPPPNEQIYIYLFKSFGKLQYHDGVFKLHLAMKTDLRVNLNITLINALMEAYTDIEDTFKVRDAFNLAAVLKDFHNWCSNGNVREMLDTFANEHYPQIWSELKQSGELVDDKETESPSLLESRYDEQFEFITPALLN
ncbi:hypothetical protein CANARDRAFT_203190 [[Candida] arabinofermentans NRRL YB-2248]|uniref:Uncharacterized protein n=1 Tax=[Candida] arabinofermentans NRRL YB-2248 TaxID=983967 RepID=A0A1E4SV38_9ASCO|nr:hypothetical protein CANARDRAFT_203190 [[Candida] arabinofermentans NRRL YB-2248]